MDELRCGDAVQLFDATRGYVSCTITRVRVDDRYDVCCCDGQRFFCVERPRLRRAAPPARAKHKPLVVGSKVRDATRTGHVVKVRDRTVDVRWSDDAYDVGVVAGAAERDDSPLDLGDAVVRDSKSGHVRRVWDDGRVDVAWSDGRKTTVPANSLRKAERRDNSSDYHIGSRVLVRYTDRDEYAATVTRRCAPVGKTVSTGTAIPGVNARYDLAPSGTSYDVRFDDRGAEHCVDARRIRLLDRGVDPRAPDDANGALHAQWCVRRLPPKADDDRTLKLDRGNRIRCLVASGDEAIWRAGMVLKNDVSKDTIQVACVFF